MLSSLTGVLPGACGRFHRPSSADTLQTGFWEEPIRRALAPSAPASQDRVLSREQQPISSHKCPTPDAYHRTRAMALGPAELQGLEDGWATP